MPANAQEFIQNLLSKADLATDGKKRGDILVRNNAFYNRVLAEGSIGLGESYMDGWWDCEDLDECFYKMLRVHLDQERNWYGILPALKAKVLNLQNRKRSMNVIHKHYDLGNDLYSAMLDERMVYTCGYWEGAQNLKEAQEAKLDLICRKINLKEGQRILDIGCGFGSFCKFAAEKYGANAVGITLSTEQATYAKESCKGLPVEIRIQDYRDVCGELYDNVVSIGMFEAVGHKNFRTYMEIVCNCLRDEGLFLLHTIGRNDTCTHADPWISKYIFPHGMLPSIGQIGKSMENIFVMEDWHNFGDSYAKTLRAWYENFEEHWGDLKEKYSQRFFRMWQYYLLSCAGAFRARDIQLWQIVLSKNGMLGEYKSVR
jgi:cyclopropane-fatty-acyl-phospholipid synthase